LIRDSDLAPEWSGVGRDVDGVLLERSERNDLEGTFMGGRQHDERGRAILVRPQPVQRGYAPAVAGHEPREAVLRHRGDQVIADATLVLEERGGNHRADRVATPVLRTGTTAPVTVKTGEGVDTTRLKLATENITIGHHTSIASQASRCRTPEALASRVLSRAIPIRSSGKPTQAAAGTASVIRLAPMAPGAVRTPPVDRRCAV
jgi:hypothetical protein